MKNALRNLTLLVALVTLAGCLEVKGVLTINEPLKLYDSTGSQDIYSASKKYSGTVSFSFEDNNLVMDLGSNFLNTRKYIFKNPKKYNTNGIRNGEKIVLTAEESGQAYDLEAMYTEEEKVLSGILTETVDCTKLVKDQFVAGKQTIKYQNISRMYGIDASLISPHSKSVVARFNGHEVKLERKQIPDMNDECK